MDEIESLRGSLRRGPWAGGDLNDVFAQKASIATIPGGVAQDLGSTPEEARFIRSGVRNGDFLALPPDPTGTISDITNKLPDWSFVSAQGTSITAAAVADANAASGYVIRFSGASGNINDEAYLEQTVPIVSNRKGAWAAHVNAYCLAPSINTATFQTVIEGAYLDATGATTGTVSNVTAAFGLSATEPTAKPGVSGTVPGDATELRIRIGIKRTATNATAATIDVCDLFLNTGTDAVLVPDDSTNSNSPASIVKRLGITSVNNGSDYGSLPTLYLDGSQSTAFVAGQQPYGAGVNRSAQSIPDATDRSIDFSSEDWDVNTLHDNSTNNERITLLKAGYWSIGGGIVYEPNNTGYRTAYVELNGKDGAGTRLLPFTRVAAADNIVSTALTVSLLRHFDANDYVTLTARQDSGVALDVDAVFWAKLEMADA